MSKYIQKNKDHLGNVMKLALSVHIYQQKNEI